MIRRLLRRALGALLDRFEPKPLSYEEACWDSYPLSDAAAYMRETGGSPLRKDGQR